MTRVSEPLFLLKKVISSPLLRSETHQVSCHRCRQYHHHKEPLTNVQVTSTLTVAVCFKTCLVVIACECADEGVSRSTCTTKDGITSRSQTLVGCCHQYQFYYYGSRYYHRTGEFRSNQELLPSLPNWMKPALEFCLPLIDRLLVPALPRLIPLPSAS